MAPTSELTLLFFLFLFAIVVFFSKPRRLILFILITVYLIPRAGFILSTSWYRYPLPAGYMLIALIMIRWFFHVITAKEREKLPPGIVNTFYFYVLTAIFGIILGFIYKGRFSVMILEILFYFAAFLIFFMIIDLFARKDCAEVFINGFLICGFLISLYGLLVFAFGGSLLIPYITYTAATYYSFMVFSEVNRTLSSYGDPNVLGAQLVVFCSIYTSLILDGRYSVMKKAFLFVSLMLTMLCIYYTNSRASLVGLFLLVVIFSATKVTKIWLYVPILAIGYLMFVEPASRGYSHRLFKEKLGLDVRASYGNLFFDLITRFPFGVGFGNTIDKYYNMRAARNMWDGFNSFYLQFFSRVGIQGLLLFVIFLFLLMRYIFTQFKYIEDHNAKQFVFGGACGIIAQQFSFISNNIYHIPGGMLNFWVMCGMLIAIINAYKGNEGSFP